MTSDNQGKTLRVMVILILTGTPTTREICARDFISPATDEVLALTGEVPEIEKRQRHLLDQLQAIALDDKRSAADRHAAIAAIGKLADRESLDFLAKHIDLDIPTDIATSEEQQGKRWVCRRALSSVGWNAIPPILRHLKQKRSDWALLMSAYVIRVKLGTETARTLINRELRDATVDLHRQNLTRVLKRFDEVSPR